MLIARLIVRRVALLAVVLLLVSVLAFAIVNVLPGDAADAMLGDLGTPEAAEALRRQLGLDLPLLERYRGWVGRLLAGDLGQSLAFHQPIATMLAGRLVNSALLAGIVLLLAVPLAVGLGVLAAARHGSLADTVVVGFTVVSFSVPEYVSGLLMILFFSIWLAVLPGTSLVEPGASPLSNPLGLVLPVAVLTLGLLAHLSQVVRAGMIAALGSAYVRTAVLKGLPMRRVVLRHALPNVMLPTISEVGMHAGSLLGGIVVVETLFSYAGVGQLLVNAVNHRDIPVVQAVVLVIAVAYGVGSLVADVLSMLLDPRLRR